MTNPTTPTPPGGGSLAYAGTVIRKRGPMLNLTDMWRAANSPVARRPAQWLGMEETAQFRAYLHTRLAEAEPKPGSNAVLDCITAPPDGLTLATRGSGGGTWAHWQLAIAYARYLSPAFHLWCNEVLRTVMEQPDLVAPKGDEGLFRYLELRFGSLDRRLDVLDRHAGDLMFLAASSQDLLLDKRRPFSERSQAVIRAVVIVQPYEGHCPSCEEEMVLNRAGGCLPGAEYDHFFHRGLNRPEHGWLICRTCHAELTYGGYLVRFAKVPEFRAFQARVVDRRRQGTETEAPPT